MITQGQLTISRYAAICNDPRRPAIVYFATKPALRRWLALNPAMEGRQYIELLSPHDPAEVNQYRELQAWKRMAAATEHRALARARRGRA